MLQTKNTLVEMTKLNWPYRPVRALFFTVAAYCFSIFALSDAAAAHSSVWTYGTDRTTVTLGFAYADQNPMQFAKVRVLSPDGALHQMGNTDRAGRFSVDVSDFPLDATWTMTATGEEDHVLEAIFVPEETLSAKETRRGFRDLMSWLLAATICLNLIVLAVLAMRRRRDVKLAQS